MIGELIGYVIFTATMLYGKFKLTQEQANKWNQKLNAGKLATFLWTLNLVTNCILIFVETIAASYPLIEKTCAACPEIYIYDEALPNFTAFPKTKPVETTTCTEWATKQVIFASDLPKETWFNIVRLILGIICVFMSLVSIFQADNPFKFGTSVVLGHATSFTKKKDKKGNGDGGYWVIVGFVIMAAASAAFYAGPIPMRYHLDQTVVWGMATGLLVSAGTMGFLVKKQKEAAGGTVDVSADDATTHKMLFSDYVIALTFLMGILGPLIGYHGPPLGGRTMSNIGTNLTACFAGYIVPFMLAAVAGTVTQQEALRTSKIAKIMSVVGAFSLVISFVLMGVAGDTFYVFLNADEVKKGDGKFTNGVGGYCTAQHTFAAAKTADPKYIQTMYCSIFKKDLTALIGLPEDAPACKRGNMQYEAIHGIKTDCRCSNTLDLDPWPEALTFASWINVTQTLNLIASVAIAIEIVTTLVSIFTSKKGNGGGNNAKVVPDG